MKVNTVEAATDESPAETAHALRRVGATVGLAIGFCLLAMFMADEANASEGDADNSQHSLESTLDDVTKPLTEKVIEPITDKVEPVTEKVLSPVLKLADPVLETVSPVVKPLTDPVLQATDPVLAPVTETVGGEQAVANISAAQAEPAANQDTSSRTGDGESNVDHPVAYQPSVTPPAADDHAAVVSPGYGEDSPNPTSPFSPAGTTTTGTTTAGSGGSHHTDSGIITESAHSRGDSTRHRGPPPHDSIVEWDGTDSGGHPS